MCRRQFLLHGYVAKPFIADRNRVALLRGVATPVEERFGRVAGVDGQSGGAASARKLFKRIDQRCRDAAARDRRVNVEHVDVVLAPQRREPDRLAIDGRHECKLRSQALGERPLVVGERSPCRLLTHVIIVGGQLLDTGGKDSGEHRCIRGKERP